MITQAVILCGGKGTRLGELTKNTPKPLLKICGVPYIQYSVNLLVKDLGEKFRYLAGGCIRVSETPDPFSLREEVLNVEGLHKMFVVLNGDCYPEMDLSSWRLFLQDNYFGKICILEGGKDAGCALVSKESVEKMSLDCSNMSGMVGVLEHHKVLDNIGIGSLESVDRASEYFRRFYGFS